MRLESQEAERIESYRPEAAHPVTPATESGKIKPTRDTAKTACPRMVKAGTCKFDKECWYFHDKKTLAKAKSAAKSDKDKGDKDKG